MAAPQYKPGKIGIITSVLQMQNIGIDGKIYQIIEARLDRVKQDNPQIGDEVEYKISASKELTEKGKISFFAIKKRANTSLCADCTNDSCMTRGEEKASCRDHKTEKPPSDLSTTKGVPETQDIQVEYVSTKQVSVTLKDCAGQEQIFRADLDVIKMIVKADSPVQSGKRYKVRLIKQGEEWVVARMGSYDESFEEKPFRTGNEILKENLDQKRAETEKAQAALDQIKKENAQGDQRMQENAEHAKELAQQQTPVDAPRASATPTTTIEPEKRQQNEAVKVSDAVAECPVELKVHLDCGSYSNFDLTVPGFPIDQAIAKIEADALKSIAMMHRLMAAAKKGY